MKRRNADAEKRPQRLRHQENPSSAESEHTDQTVKEIEVSAQASLTRTVPALQAIPLDLIDEDPNQPRTAKNPGFSARSLGELASTIKDRGVKSPISVREHPEVQGRYIINHGARRYRASRLAQRVVIPAFIDNDYHEVDQVIENLQRNALTAREIADFIGRELAKGLRKGVIARSLGKSKAFVSQHAALLDLPDPIAEAFNRGRVRDVTVVNELLQAFKHDAEAVALWITDESQELTRKSVKLLREFLAEKHLYDDASGSEPVSADEIWNEPEDERAPPFPNSDSQVRQVPRGSVRLHKPKLRVMHQAREASILLNRCPSREGWAWIRYEADGTELEVELTSVQLVALTEGQTR